MRRSALWLVLVVLVPATTAGSVVTYMDVPTLVRLSPVIVRGTVVSVAPVLDDVDATLHTEVRVSVAESVRDPAGSDVLTLHLLGGRYGVREARVFGSPTFRVGEDVVVFARPTKAGRLTVTGLYQGKIAIETRGGVSFAVRSGPPDPGRVMVLGRSQTEPAEVPLAAWLDALREHVRDVPSIESWSPVDASTSASNDVVDPIAPSFTLLGLPVRRFEPDDGLPVPYRFNPNGASATVPGGARAAFVAALGAWNMTTGHALVLVDGGDTTAQCFVGFDGVTGVSHGDPCGEMAAFDSGSCSGVLAIGGMSELNPFESKVVNGVSFLRGLQGDVVFNDGADCFWSGPGNYEEVLSHEIGHTLGLGHSCGDVSSPSCDGNEELDEAQMRAFAHGDGRGADPRRDDVKGVRSIYPPAAFIDLLVNDGPFSTGDTFELTLDLNGTAVADLWFVFVAPGMEPTGRKLQSSLPLTFLADLPIASYTFTGVELAGDYIYAMLLTVPGGNPTLPADVLSFGFAVVPFNP